MVQQKIVWIWLFLLAGSLGFAQGEADKKGSLEYTSPYLSGKDETWEGRVTKLGYSVKSAANPASMLQIGRNYENALTKVGAKILVNEGRVIEGKIAKDGGLTYVHVEAFNDGREYTVVVVEKGAMKQDVTADAAALSASIAATGKAAVYGIYFDTGKAMIRPESAPTLAEITKLLKQQSGLSLFVVGHTDSVGALDYNLKLSAASKGRASGPTARSPPTAQRRVRPRTAGWSWWSRGSGHGRRLRPLPGLPVFSVRSSWV